jgi:hypothetical protein
MLSNAKVVEGDGLLKEPAMQVELTTEIRTTYMQTQEIG